jgi:L-rhamnose-H+ transport protein
MNLHNPALGVSLVLVAGLISGAFTVPSIGIRSWKWEHIWLVYSISAYALTPVGLALVFAPGILFELVSVHPALAVKIGAFGLLFGIGSLLFGVSWKKLGLAIANALVTGVIVMVGSVGPVVLGAAKLDRRGRTHLAAGVAPLAASLALCAIASVLRDRRLGLAAAYPRTLGDSLLGILIPTVAGAFSAMLNVGFSLGNVLVENAGSHGHSPLLATLAVWIPILLGGLIANSAYPSFLIQRQGEWQSLFRGRSDGVRWLRCFLMGVLWFGAIFLYGYGASFMGSTGTVYGWALVSGAGVLGSNTVGALAGEWKGAGAKPVLLMWLSTGFLFASFGILSAG